MGETTKPIVVFSGVNFTEGGPLSVMKDAVRAFVTNYSSTYQLLLLVHDKKLFEEFNNYEIFFIEYPASKFSWRKRLGFEYIKSLQISKKNKPYLWLSLHDISARVVADRKAVYCHNPAPFYKASLKEAKLEPPFFLFSIFYKFLYRINIKSNDYIIVQQDWLRQEFKKRFKVNNVVVAYPDVSISSHVNAIQHQKRPYTFFYPSFPRVFKNFEIFLEAARILSQKRTDFKVVITIDGNENRYSAFLKTQFSDVSAIKFIGKQTRESVFQIYKEADCLVFPSKLETWGLPISEMKQFNKPILAAAERYAYETVGLYDKVKFFPADNAQALAVAMESLITGTITFDNNNIPPPDQPFVQGWKELLQFLLHSPKQNNQK